MPTAQPELKPNRRGLWLAVAAVVALLALTTWDVVRQSGGGGGSAAELRRAAFDGDEGTVRRIIAAHPEWIDIVGSTNGQTRVLGGLYDKAMKSFGKSPSAVSPGDPDKYFQLLEGLGATPLFHAIVRKRLGTAMFLLEARANPSAMLVTGSPVVFTTVAVGDTNLMAELVRRGAKLDVLDKSSDMTLLHYAAMCQRPEMLTFLIERGLSANTTNRAGLTPMHFAVNFRKLPIVEILATNGADLTIASSRGETALDHAAKNATDSNGAAILAWLEAFASTNQAPAKPAP